MAATLLSELKQTAQEEAQTELLVNHFLALSQVEHSIGLDPIQDVDLIPDAISVLPLPKLPLKQISAAQKTALNTLATALLDESPALLDALKPWLISFSSSNSKNLRLVSTTTCCILLHAAAKSLHALSSQQIIKHRQSKRSQKQPQSSSPNNSSQLEYLQNLSTELFDAVFIHRYRDTDPQIRATCLNYLSLCIITHRQFYHSPNYFRYFGWLLFDKSAIVRSTSVSGLLKIFTSAFGNSNSSSGPSGSVGVEGITELRGFSDRFSPRLVQMSQKEIDFSVRELCLQLISTMYSVGVLEDVSPILGLICDRNDKVRKCVAGVCKNVFIELCEDSDDTEENENDEKSSSSRDPVGVFSTFLKDVLKSVENLEREDDISIQQFLQTVDIESPNSCSEFIVDQSYVDDVKLVTEYADRHTPFESIESRIRVIVNELYDHIPILQNWTAVMEFIQVNNGDEEYLGPVLYECIKKTMSVSSSVKGKKGKSEEVDVVDVSNKVIKKLAGFLKVLIDREISDNKSVAKYAISVFTLLDNSVFEGRDGGLLDNLVSTLVQFFYKLDDVRTLRLILQTFKKISEVDSDRVFDVINEICDTVVSAVTESHSDFARVESLVVKVSLVAGEFAVEVFDEVEDVLKRFGGVGEVERACVGALSREVFKNMEKFLAEREAGKVDEESEKVTVGKISENVGKLHAVLENMLSGDKDLATRVCAVLVLCELTYVTEIVFSGEDRVEKFELAETVQIEFQEVFKRCVDLEIYSRKVRAAKALGAEDIDLIDTTKITPITHSLLTSFAKLLKIHKLRIDLPLLSEILSFYKLGDEYTLQHGIFLKYAQKIMKSTNSTNKSSVSSQQLKKVGKNEEWDPEAAYIMKWYSGGGKSGGLFGGVYDGVVEEVCARVWDLNGIDEKKGKEVVKEQIEDIVTSVVEGLVKVQSIYLTSTSFTLDPALSLATLFQTTLKNWTLYLSPPEKKPLKKLLIEYLKDGLISVLRRGIESLLVKYIELIEKGGDESDDEMEMTGLTESKGSVGSGSGKKKEVFVKMVKEISGVEKVGLEKVKVAWRLWGVVGGSVKFFLKSFGVEDGNMNELLEQITATFLQHDIKPVEGDPEWTDYFSFIKSVEKGDSNVVGAKRRASGVLGRKKVASSRASSPSSRSSKSTKKRTATSSKPTKRPTSKRTKKSKQETEEDENDDENEDSDMAGSGDEQYDPKPTRRSGRVLAVKSYREDEDSDGDAEEVVESSSNSSRVMNGGGNVSTAVKRKARDEEEEEEEEEEDEKPKSKKPATKKSVRSTNTKKPATKKVTKPATMNKPKSFLEQQEVEELESEEEVVPPRWNTKKAKTDGGDSPVRSKLVVTKTYKSPMKAKKNVQADEVPVVPTSTKSKVSKKVAVVEYESSQSEQSVSDAEEFMNFLSQQDGGDEEDVGSMVNGGGTLFSLGDKENLDWDGGEDDKSEEEGGGDEEEEEEEEDDEDMVGEIRSRRKVVI